MEKAWPCAASATSCHYSSCASYLTAPLPAKSSTVSDLIGLGRSHEVELALFELPLVVDYYWPLPVYLKRFTNLLMTLYH